MDIILTLLALFPSLLQANPGSSSAASIDQFEIQQSIQTEYILKMDSELEFTYEIVGLV